MTERFCRNNDGDCPCFVIIRNSELFLSGIIDWFWQCRLFPEHKEFTTDPRRHYCYYGRQIMEQQATPNDAFLEILTEARDGIQLAYDNALQDDPDTWGEVTSIKNRVTVFLEKYKNSGGLE